MHARRIVEAIRKYAACPPEHLGERLAAEVVHAPGCAVTRYLLACHLLDAGRPATAVRHLMVAHHGCPQFESAALLVFAGLNGMAQRGAPLLPVLLATWDEFRRPIFDRWPLERRLLDAFAEPDPGVRSVSALAARLWRLPIQSLRSQLRAAVATRDAYVYPLLLAAV